MGFRFWDFKKSIHFGIDPSLIISQSRLSNVDCRLLPVVCTIASLMRIYCSGTGGIGLSAYAALQKANGHEVHGSDRTESDILDSLREQGISVALNQDGTFIPEDADLFVFSEAIPKDSPERKRADELGIRSITYFQALGEISRDHTVIAVCGTHGKSSTVAMAARVLIELGMDPTVIAGTKLKELNNSNWRKGKGEYFLLEACEYRRSFLNISPNIILMTNADGDHFDAFDSVEDYQEAFVEFIQCLSVNGIVVTHMEDKDCANIVRKTKKEVYAVDQFTLPDLNVPGKHMKMNAQLVLGLAGVLGIPEEEALESLKGYSGCWRRMEVLGNLDNGVTVIDDYAHHPLEIKATVQAMLEGYPNRRLVAVFQPHMHDRTLKLYDEFIKSFGGIDILVLTDVYDARHDVEKESVDMEKFASDIKEGSQIDVLYGKNLNCTQSMLKNDILKPDDVLLIMGAGDVTDMARSMVSE